MKRATKVLAAIVESDEDFEDRMDAYVKAGGEVPKDFLEQLDRARRVWQRIRDDSAPDEFASLPSMFQKAIVELLTIREDGKTLVEILRIVTDKSTTKAIRKALHILRRKGVEVPEVETKQPEAKAAKTEQQKPSSIVTLPLADGSQELYLVGKFGREFHVVSMVIYHGEGIRDYGTFSASKAALRDLKEKLTEIGRAPIEVSYELAYSLIERAMRWHDERGTAPPQGFISTLRRWEKPKDAARIDAPQHTDDWRSAIADSIKLFDHPPFNHWVLPWEEERKFEQKVNEIYTSRVIPTEAKKIELISDQINRTVDEFFGEHRELFAGIFRDAAELLHISDRRELARIALAVAIALEDTSLPPSRIPFLRAIISKRLMLRTPEGAKSFDEIEREPVIKQGDKTSDGSKSPGGIIIPG
ncbi:MAG TPA: hypothetical protein ENF73_00675 [Proteobacteria bacterium]|nr:hypothetical protein [Pseudomonadota bacterium]